MIDRYMMDKDITEIDKLRNKLNLILNLIKVYCCQAQKRGWARDHGCVEKFIKKILNETNY